MKTLNFKSNALRTALTIAAVTISVNMMAQPKWSRNKILETEAAEKRLEALISSSELSARYVAPAIFEEDMQVEFDRLDMLADHIEKEIRYEAPQAETITETEFASEVTNPADSIQVRDAEFLTSSK